MRLQNNRYHVMWNKVSPPDDSHSGVVGAAGCQLSLEVAKARSEQRKLYKKFWLVYRANECNDKVEWLQTMRETENSWLMLNNLNEVVLQRCAYSVATKVGKAKERWFSSPETGIQF